jgi:hypothetical protein
MALIDVERAVLSICFEAEPPEAALRALGQRERWLLYRELTRDRLLHEIRSALPRTCAAVGDERLNTAFREHLDRDPPRTRFFREVVMSFATSALRTFDRDSSLPSHARDLLRYEAALWEVSDLEAPAAGEALEFSFDRVPVVTPALRLLHVTHAVHLPADAEGSCSPGEFWLCVQQDPEDARSRTWNLNRTSYLLLEEFQRARSSAADGVQRVAKQLGRRVTPQFVDHLCESLAQWIEVGILVGSR